MKNNNDSDKYTVSNGMPPRRASAKESVTPADSGPKAKGSSQQRETLGTPVKRSNNKRKASSNHGKATVSKRATKSSKGPKVQAIVMFTLFEVLRTKSSVFLRLD